MRHSLINSVFLRTYNPSSYQNALSDIKRLLTCRDTPSQEKACGYLIEVLTRYNKQSKERTRLVEYLLDNDITVFLCEAISNLDLNLFRSFVRCVRLLWCARLFSEQHAAQCAAAAMRALQHEGAVEAMHFLYDLLNGVSEYKSIPALSHQSAFSADQLLACLSSLAPRLTTPPTILSSALVLQALISYQPEELDLRSHTVTILVEVLGVWFSLMVGSLNHAMLLGDKDICGMFFAVMCQLGVDVLRLAKLLSKGRHNPNFVQSILADEQEMSALRQCAVALKNSVYQFILELVGFTKDNQNQISTDEYGVFLKLVLDFFYNCETAEQLPEFCDVLVSKGYLTMLPQSQIARSDSSIRKVSTLVLGEMLKGLAQKYLYNSGSEDNTCAKDIHMGLVELQFGIEKPHSIGSQLQKSQPYSLLVYIYFYCQSSENPEEATAPLLPYLVEHILRLPATFRPPPYITKALWLVFAMSTISSAALSSLDERLHLEKATDRLVSMLQPDPSAHYTHNPALLLWAFTSHRIPDLVRMHVLSQWFKTEDCLPSELSSQPAVWKLLLNILTQCRDALVLQNCTKSIYSCLEDMDEDEREDFGLIIWPMLPEVLSKALIDSDSAIETNICCLLELSFMLVPREVNQTLCLKLAILTTAIFVKIGDDEARHDYEYACLKLSLHLLGLAKNQYDNKVLPMYMARSGFLPRVLSATNSLDTRVACIALHLLSYIVHYFTKNNYQPKSILQIQTHLVIRSLRGDNSPERGASLLQLVYMVLNSGPQTPLVLTYNLEHSPEQQCGALRALMLRIQMLCCRESKNQSSACWKTLSAIFKHAIINKNDPKLLATLTSQPWTYTLINFQITQKITEEFLTFTHRWLTLTHITLKKAREERKIKMSKQGLVCKTLLLLKKYLVAEGDDVKRKILVIAEEILDDSDINI